ncbi:hypothetical protein GCM10010198_06770 [Nocardia seriolae]|nr:hypothetical protein NSERKGN1266_19080 [Nocardia seriolae]GEM27086.1 hypothetical protein NS2_53250 [Nocardia seriolae NBRC 15557]
MVSERVNGTSKAAAPAHTSAAFPARRSARYPPTSSTPLPCGGTKNAANNSDPTVNAAAKSATARTAGNPYVVNGPGSGIPSSVSACAADSATTSAATSAAAAPPSAAIAANLTPDPDPLTETSDSAAGPCADDMAPA